MAVEHRDIPDGQRHEPKGASTAAAGSVWVANGTGSGSFQPITTVIPLPASYPAQQVTIIDVGNLIGSGNVEGALQELAQYLSLIRNTAIYPDNAAAVTAGLQVGQFYHTASGEFRVVV